MPAEGESPPRPSGLPPLLGAGPGEADALLLLRCLQGITPLSLHAVVWESGSASQALRAIRAGRAGSDGDRAFLAGARPDHIRDQLRRAGARFAPPGHPDYWPALLRLADPPVAVFVRGLPLELGEDRVAVIGSRRPTSVGRAVAVDLGRGLAAAGVSVVSGAAVGTDGAAHLGALDAGGRTVAVLGSGIDTDYPPRNRDLLKRIESAGTIVSEYPPGVPPEPHRFPARNRVIAALSRAVVVVEGAEHSGTRITVEHASELGLDLYAVPGSVTSPLSETPLGMIRDGARMIRGAADLLEDLGIRRAPDAPPPRALPQDERRVLETLAERLLPETVAERAGLSASEALAALIGLELRGLVRCSGGRWERAFVGSTGESRTA